jgi:hypothetical protein
MGGMFAGQFATLEDGLVGKFGVGVFVYEFAEGTNDGLVFGRLVAFGVVLFMAETACYQFCLDGLSAKALFLRCIYLFGLYLLL